MKYTNTLQLIRIKDWFKNLIIFFPIIFSGKILEYSNYINLIIGFILFSIVCSSVYILNDIIDKNKDKIHPIKKNIKPLESSTLPKLIKKPNAIPIKGGLVTIFLSVTMMVSPLLAIESIAIMVRLKSSRPSIEIIEIMVVTLSSPKISCAIGSTNKT